MVQPVSSLFSVTSMDTVEVFNGIRFPGFIHTQESLRAACSFLFQDKDILLVTFPKSGESWVPHRCSASPGLG